MDPTQHCGVLRVAASSNQPIERALQRRSSSRVRLLEDSEWNFSGIQIKPWSNERKHGVTFPEALGVFNDDLSSTVPDPDHSEGEYRYLIFGQSESGNHLVVPYTPKWAFDPPGLQRRLQEEGTHVCDFVLKRSSIEASSDHADEGFDAVGVDLGQLPWRSLITKMSEQLGGGSHVLGDSCRC